MSSEDWQAKRSRFQEVEAILGDTYQETANEIFDKVRRYTWSQDKFGPNEFYVVYAHKLKYDIEPYVLDILVQATHDSLQEIYKGSPFVEELVPSFQVFVALLDCLVANYKP